VLRRLAVLVIAAGGAAFAPSAFADGPPFAPCAANGLECATLSVPLDYSGITPGEVPLYVEELPAAGTPRGVMFMLAGGPGQASAETFDLADQGAYWQSYFPGYTLVAYDDRGTGKSGALPDCTTIGTYQACANAIPNNRFYTSGDHAHDIDSVRAALGADKVALWGVSYGTKHAVAYALLHPDRVERLLLDSELLPDRDPLGLDSIRAIPGSIDGICPAGVCPSLPGSTGARFAALANRLNTSPVTSNVTPTPAGTVAVRADGHTLVGLAYESDLSNGVSSELPAAIDAATNGWTLPLARLVALDGLVQKVTSTDIDTGLYFSTTCGDGPFPWNPAADFETRANSALHALAAVPEGATGPIGSWALSDSSTLFCMYWPSSGAELLPSGPLPDVPVLVLSGSRDIRTPTSAAVAIASRFPQGRVLVVPGSGHSVLDRSPCAATAVQGWLDGAAPPAVCTRTANGVPPLARWRKTVTATPPAPHVPGLAGRTLAALLQTLHDAEDAWLLGRQSTSTVTGMVGGTMVPDAVKTIHLHAYSSVGGLAVSGTIVLALAGNGQPAIPLTATSGTLTVTGRGAAHGKLTAAGNTLSGTLGGRKIRAAF
jgi:pimeloyl-ACP methyl ester carboxylesterase